MTLIKRVSNSDRRYLRQLPSDTQCLLHGLFVVREYTGEPEIQRVWRLKDALSAIDRHRLYHFVTSEFSCVHEERNWKGLDITVRFRIRICPTEKGFARWLTEDSDAWDGTRTEICAAALEALVQNDARYGLALYVRKCLENANLGLLKEYGAKSWPDSATRRLCVPWLEVACVEDVGCLPARRASSPEDRGPDSGNKAPGRAGGAQVDNGVVQPDAVLMGRYKLVRKLGGGGMGEAWLAEDQRLDHVPVTVKLIHSSAAESDCFWEDFKNEALALRALNNPNIARFYDCHTEIAGMPFMVLEYVEGESLLERVDSKTIAVNEGRLQRNPCSEEDVRRLLMPIAKALDYCHERGVFHRDIKSSNILVRSDGTPILTDFGIAHRVRGGRELTMRHFCSGTLPYMPPECIAPGAEKGLPIAVSEEELPRLLAAGDIYSFAMTAYECLTGTLPLATIDEVLRVIPPIPPVGGPFARNIMLALSKDWKARPKTCLQLFEGAVRSPSSVPGPQKGSVSQPPTLRYLCERYRNMLADSANEHRKFPNDQVEVGVANDFVDLQKRLLEMSDDDLPSLDEGKLAEFFAEVQGKRDAYCKDKPHSPYFVEHRRLSIQLSLERTSTSSPVLAALSNSISPKTVRRRR